jgi:NAD(P) transhydrogenase
VTDGGAPRVERFDLVVIGSGPAGEKGAAQAAYFGKSVALVERLAEPGGVSVHTGTLPSKTLRESALYLTGFRRRELYGMTLRLDRQKSLRQLTGRLRDVTAAQTRQIKRNFERHRITTITGRARFLDPRTVGVFDPDGVETRRLGFDAALVAVGSSPLPPRGLTFDDPDVEDSDRILDLDRIPRSLAVVGGGVIGCEYASLFAALGTTVTLIEGRDRLLGFLDGEVSSTLKIALERMGGEVLLGDAVETISREANLKANALRLTLKSGRVLAADKVLFSAGRRGNTEGLGLEQAGVVFDEKGRIPVDDHFQTNVPRIYAAGDVVGFPALAATSMEQARVAACHAFDIPFKTAVARLFPYGVYTIPEVSMIGATEEELKERGIPYEVGRARYENNARGQITGDLDGFVKLVFDPATRKLLGAHLIGGGATELVHVAQMVMLKEGGLDDFIHSVFNFPTLAECFKYAAYDGLQRLSHREGSTPLERMAEVAASNAGSHPPARAWFVGIDLTDPFARTSRPVTLALMDRWRRVRFVTWTYDPTGERMIPEHVAAEGFVVAIDGPQGLAARGRAMRQAERVLRAPGKSGEALAGAGKPYAGFIRGSVELFGALRKSGLGLLGEAPWETTALLEVYPGDTWPKWAGRRPPKKSLPAGRRARYDILREHGLELPVGCDAVTHDQLDAAAAALLAYLWATGNAREFGDPPLWDAETGCIREGIIVSV